MLHCKRVARDFSAYRIGLQLAEHVRRMLRGSRSDRNFNRSVKFGELSFRLVEVGFRYR